MVLSFPSYVQIGSRKKQMLQNNGLVRTNGKYPLYNLEIKTLACVNDGVHGSTRLSLGLNPTPLVTLDS